MKAEEFKQQKGETEIQWFERLITSKVKARDVVRELLESSYANVKMLEIKVETERSRIAMFESILKNEGYN